jgi:3-dehydroquinate synthase
MSVSFDIESSTGSYHVDINPGLYGQLVQAPPPDVVFICDERFAPTLTAAGCKVIALAADERVKSLDQIPDVIVRLRALGTTRATRLLALGGGIVQDVAAFCSSIYMRGLVWSYLPTTLLGMADSCIGGKSSINVGDYKNIVGTFYPPESVQVDPELARTLSLEQVVAGLCEVAKICFCRGPEAFAEYRALSAAAGPEGTSEATLPAMIALSLRSKKWFIEIDEFDRGERLLLNFGHTFEGVSHFRISHGVAVGLGMLAALALGRLTGIDYGAHDDVAFLGDHTRQLLKKLPALRTHLLDPKLSVAGTLDYFKADKKHAKDAYRVVMVGSDGKAILRSFAKTAENEELLGQAIHSAWEEVRV